MRRGNLKNRVRNADFSPARRFTPVSYTPAPVRIVAHHIQQHQIYKARVTSARAHYLRKVRENLSRDPSSLRRAVRNARTDIIARVGFDPTRPPKPPPTLGKRVRVCAARHIRREVLFAEGHGGRGGRKSDHKRNAESAIKC